MNVTVPEQDKAGNQIIPVDVNDRSLCFVELIFQTSLLYFKFVESVTGRV